MGLTATPDPQLVFSPSAATHPPGLRQLVLTGGGRSCKVNIPSTTLAKGVMSTTLLHARCILLVLHEIL